VESLSLDFPAVAEGHPVTAAVLGQLPATLREGQALFDLTGGLHAAAAVDESGRVAAVREDVGRHNAVDKVVGRLLLDGRLPASDLLLAVSGRAGYEVVQKAVAAGFPIVAAVGAPSSLAVATAERFGVTLIGFLRANRFNVYSAPSRVVS
jgi:FdhD protein